MSVRIKAIGVILLTTLIIIVISVSSGISLVRNNIEQSQEADLALIADIADHFVSSEIGLLKLKASQIASLLTSATPSEWSSILTHQVSLYSEFIGGAIINRNTGVSAQYGYAPASRQIFMDVNVQKAFTSNQAMLTSTIPNDAETGVVIYLVAPIASNSESLLAITLEGTHFQKLLAEFVVWDTGHIFIDDAEGYIIANIRSEWVQQRHNFNELAKSDNKYQEVAMVIQKGMKGETLVDRFSIDNIPRLCALTPISSSEEGWFLGVIAPLAESPFRHIDNGMITIGIVSVLLSIIAATLASSFIKRLFEQVIDLKEKAELNSKAKGDFLASMSHEIRPPMNAIIGLTTLGSSADDIERVKNYLQKINEASQHLLGVINNILDMSKIEAGMFDLSHIEFHFEKALHRVVNIMKYKADEKQQLLIVHIDPNIPAFLIGDDNRLAQVVANLMSNAIKFTPVLGTIALDAKLVKVENEMAEVLIAVSDTGIGMTQEQIRTLFRSFQQADKNTSRTYGGTGLGLALSKDFVNMMNGHIWVESVPGEGSVFSFTVQMQISTKEYVPLQIGNERLHNLRVLVADNDKLVLEYFSEIIRSFGLSNDVASDGAEALELVRQNGNYDIYFIDWKMPGLNGIELTGKLRALDSKASITIITAAEIRDFEEDAKKAGATKSLTKPVFPSTIADVISDHLGTSRHNEPSVINDMLPSFAGYHILVSEDVDINREIVEEFLAPTGLQMTFAQTGKEALEIFAASPEIFDLILMDIQMPEMDGYEATRSIRNLAMPHAKKIPIIAMTANVYKEDVEKCFAAGMDSHIGKPFSLQDLYEMLNQYLPCRQTT